MEGEAIHGLGLDYYPMEGEVIRGVLYYPVERDGREEKKCVAKYAAQTDHDKDAHMRYITRCSC